MSIYVPMLPLANIVREKIKNHENKTLFFLPLSHVNVHMINTDMLNQIGHVMMPTDEFVHICVSVCEKKSEVNEIAVM